MARSIVSSSDQQHFVDRVLQNRQRQLADVATAMPSAIVSPPTVHRQAVQPLVHRAVVLRLHAQHLDAGLERPGRGRHARDQPAAADRHHQRVELRRLLEHLQRDGALAGDHRGVVVGMDEGEALARLDLVRVARRLGERVAFDAPLPRPAPACCAAWCSACRAASRSPRARRAASRGRRRPARGCRRSSRSRRACAPRRRARSSLLSAPRSLNEAVNCRFSNLSQTSAPVSCDSVRLCRQGVRATAPAMRCAAARMSSRVTLMPIIVS